eukprot:3307647-Rhodomonas_salina.1
MAFRKSHTAPYLAVKREESKSGTTQRALCTAICIVNCERLKGACISAGPQYPVPGYSGTRVSRHVKWGYARTRWTFMPYRKPLLSGYTGTHAPHGAFGILHYGPEHSFYCYFP